MESKRTRFQELHTSRYENRLQPSQKSSIYKNTWTNTARPSWPSIDKKPPWAYGYRTCRSRPAQRPDWLSIKRKSPPALGNMKELPSCVMWQHPQLGSSVWHDNLARQPPMPTGLRMCLDLPRTHKPQVLKFRWAQRQHTRQTTHFLRQEHTRHVNHQGKNKSVARNKMKWIAEKYMTTIQILRPVWSLRSPSWYANRSVPCNDTGSTAVNLNLYFTTRAILFEQPPELLPKPNQNASIHSMKRMRMRNIRPLCKAWKQLRLLLNGGQETAWQAGIISTSSLLCKTCRTDI